MAENYGICLVGIMDRLWFHHIILFPEPHSLYFSETPKNTSLAMSETFAYSSTNNSQTSLLPEGEISSATDAITPPQDDECNNKNSEKETTPKERPTRLNLQANKTRSHSSAPSVQKRGKILHSPGAMRLQKTMSCKSLWELELEEVKGFMDLGFRFDKKHMTKRMMRVIPGLQRLEQHNKDEMNILDNKNEGTKDDEVEDDENDKEDDDDDDDDDDDGDEKRGIIRPYLSEAWLIKRPDSPLLNLRVPRASAAADMKKHLKYWARTVATVIQQES